MLHRPLILALALTGLAACDDLVSTSPNNVAPPPGTTASDLPPELLAIVGPNQNLDSVRIDPTNGCYIYRYAGPVETTFLPLRTREGREICVERTPAPVPTPAT